MNPAASLDLFVLTFNCAKNIIDVEVFARHLQNALQQHGQRRGGDGSRAHDPVELPDLVVFSLQEISPLAQSFVGGYLLNPYLMPFKEALNLAAGQVEYEQQEQQQPQQPAKGAASRRSSRPQPTLQRASTSTLSTLWRRQQDYPYKLVASRNVGMTAIMMFARKPDAIHHLQFAECAFGIADMGNKGAIALRVTYSGAGHQDDQRQDEAAEQRTTEITFVATHLAAMEYNLRRRNANWASIVSSCTFVNPKEIVSPQFHDDKPAAKNRIDASTKSNGGKQTDGGQDIPEPDEDERNHLLKRRRTFKAMPKDEASRLHDATIFKPGSHLFVAGDLNYRVSTTSPPTTATFPTLDDYMYFFENDQLTEERRANRTLHGLSEAEVKFPPTYKIKHLSPNKVDEATNRDEVLAGGQDVVPWKWAPHRWPGWCDRILYLDIPPWAKQKPGTGEIVIHKYNSMPTMLSSDHQPVFLRVSVPLLTPEELSPGLEDLAEYTEDSEGEQEGSSEGRSNFKDPRVHLPIPVDLDASQRRASARKKELMTGMTTLFFSTREGAVVLSTFAIVSLMTWWLLRGGL